MRERERVRLIEKRETYEKKREKRMSDGKNDSSQALQIERSKSSVVQHRHRPVEKMRSKCGENKVRVHRKI